MSPLVRLALVPLAVALAGCGSSAASAVSTGPADATADAPPASATDGGPLATPDATLPPNPGADAGACGYSEAGTPLHVATNVELCMPPVTCNSETCPPPLGDCVSDRCVFKAGYQGVATLPEAWVTYYCQLSTGGCHGVTQLQFPEVTAGKISASTGFPLCEQAEQSDGGTGECVGIAAAPPMIVGNSQEAVDPTTNKPVADWGLGLTEASGLCYELTGPGGVALVALTDRCGGYCQCRGSGIEECGPCVNAPDMQVQCPCVGTAPPAYGSCCGVGCGGAVNAQCDWCASNNHPHFDLDTGTFNLLCGALANRGSCKLSAVRYVHCLDATGWPPP